jgi:hypothetical protein
LEDKREDEFLKVNKKAQPMAEPVLLLRAQKTETALDGKDIIIFCYKKVFCRFFAYILYSYTKEAQYV